MRMKKIDLAAIERAWAGQAGPEPVAEPGRDRPRRHGTRLLVALKTPAGLGDHTHA